MQSKKQRSHDSVSIIGPGNVGRSLAIALHEAGVRVTEIVTRDEAASRKRGAALAKQVKARLATVTTGTFEASMIWICVSDAAIASVASQLAKLAMNWKGKTVLHASGALASSELLALKKRGADVAAFHPMNTFVAGGGSILAGTPFGAEGDEGAIRRATRLIQRASKYPVRVFRIRAPDRPLYHALGAFASPLMISTLNVAERIARSIGIRGTYVMTPILCETVANFMISGGTAKAFSGPIRRGDTATIRKHLTALKKIPGAVEAYRALALNAVDHLPAKNRAEIRALLKKKK